MKKKLAITAMALCTLLFIACLASAAPNCPLWLGTWEVKYADNSTRIWKIYEADNDTGSSYVLCEALGYSETPAGTDQILFKIIYMTFTSTYSYTEATEFSSSMPSREMDVNSCRVIILHRSRVDNILWKAEKRPAPWFLPLQLSRQRQPQQPQQ